MHIIHVFFNISVNIMEVLAAMVLIVALIQMPASIYLFCSNSSLIFRNDKLLFSF